MKMSLPKKKKKKIFFFFFFFFLRETPTSPWVPFRAKFRPLGRLFRPSRPPSLVPGFIYMQPQKVKFKIVQIKMKQVS